MGHYMDVVFDAKLNKVGLSILSDVVRTHDWRVTAENFTEYKFVELFEREGANQITRSPHSSLKDDKHGSMVDETSERWVVHTVFKWQGGRVDDALVTFLPYIVTEPVEVSIHHELWDNPRRVTVQPLVTPEADWDRKYGD